MAQVVLTAIGGAVGGPMGGFIGATIGRKLDDRMIAGLSPARQKGPRLEALNLQSSADGAPMACVFGRARTAGQVIWAARFLEHKNKQSGGKSGQKTVEYDYSLSFAVALGEGPIDGVGRVWADGQPLDLKGVTMRVHRGTTDQTPDPLIEAVEGVAPAFRGTAYAVFEDLPLGPFGNRAPQLAFEVFRRAPGEGRLEDLLGGGLSDPWRGRVLPGHRDGAASRGADEDGGREHASCRGAGGPAGLAGSVDDPGTESEAGQPDRRLVRR